MSPSTKSSPELPTRRRALQLLAGLGIGTAVFQRSLAAQVEAAGKVTPEMISQAEWIAGLELSEAERKAAADAVGRDLQKYAALRKAEVDYNVPPALHFFVEPPQLAAREPRGTVRPTESDPPERPKTDEDLAFLPVTELAALLRARKVS